MDDPHHEDVDALKQLSIFGALKPSTIEFLLERCERVTVRDGGVFFVQGQTGDSVFVLRRGRVAVVRGPADEGIVLAELDAGACFGEVALVAISPRTATVRALVECEALRLRSAALLDLYAHDLEQFTLLQMNLGREVARRLAQADEALFEYARRCGETRREPVRERAARTVK